MPLRTVENGLNLIKTGMTVRVGNESYTITSISSNAVIDNTALTDYAMSLGGFQDGEYVYELSLDKDLEPGNLDPGHYE